MPCLSTSGLLDGMQLSSLITSFHGVVSNNLNMHQEAVFRPCRWSQLEITPTTKTLRVRQLGFHHHHNGALRPKPHCARKSTHDDGYKSSCKYIHQKHKNNNTWHACFDLTLVRLLYFIFLYTKNQNLWRVSLPITNILLTVVRLCSQFFASL